MLKGSHERQPGDMVLVGILLKVLYELGCGRFCWLFRDLGLCPEGSEEPQEDVSEERPDFLPSGNR